MPKRITIAPHLPIEELEGCYRQAKDPVERSHYQIIWLLAQGKPSEEVASVTGYSRIWIYELVRGYNRVGPEMLGDLRHQNPGATPLLDDVQQANLWQALQGLAPDGGLWNGRKVAEYLSELIGQPIARQQGWEYREADAHATAGTETFSPGGRRPRARGWEKKTPAGGGASPNRTSRRRR